MGIASDGSPLFLHHITDLRSTRREPHASIVALVGFQRSTTVVAVTSKDCFQWMLSASAISILERLAAKHGRFYKRLLATLSIRV
jgi:hypothetical protein